MQFLLRALHLPIAALAVGEFGQCLFDMGLPAGTAVQCDPPNTLPQVCQLQCEAGYIRTGTATEFMCMNALCTNTCQARNRTCVGSVPVTVTSSAGETYTDYVREERPCCELTKQESPWCNLGSCTGNCGNPGVYTFDALSCPDVCVPYRDVEKPNFGCTPCVLPSLSYPATYNAIIGNPPIEATVGCIAGMWGSTQTTKCTSTGTWSPAPIVQCSPCDPHTYPLESLDTEYYYTVDEMEGRVYIECREDLGWIPDGWVFECDPTTGVWTPWLTEMTCQEMPEPSVTPTPSGTPSSSPRSPTPSNSKSPRPAKVKGSRAPTAPPKIRGSMMPSFRGSV